MPPKQEPEPEHNTTCAEPDVIAEQQATDSDSDRTYVAELEPDSDQTYVLQLDHDIDVESDSSSVVITSIDTVSIVVHVSVIACSI